MVLEHITVLVGDIALDLFDPLVAKLDDDAGFQADHMIVVRAIRQLEYGRAALEIVSADETGLLELGQHPIDGGEPEFFPGVEQQPINPLGAQVALLRVLEDLKDLEPGRSYLESRVAQVLSFHVLISGAVLSCVAIMKDTPSRLYRAAAGATLLLSALLASGCVYRIDIQQGNLLEQEAVEQIEIGMSQSAVQFLLGTPTVADPFHAGRWDYPYYHRRGRSPDIELRWLVVFFEDGRVSRIDLDRTLDPAS